MTTLERDLKWEGCFNVRDLGGLRTSEGGLTRRGAIVRADGLNRLTDAGWSALESHGIRTVVDLRNDHELLVDVGVRPSHIETVRVPLDDLADTDFWEHVWSNDLDGSPLYFGLFLERKPHQCAAAVQAIVNARPGDVVFHCGRGRDRTGLTALLVLALARVLPGEIVADYETSTERVRRLDAALGEKDQGSEISEILKRKQTSARAFGGRRVTLLTRQARSPASAGLLSRAVVRCRYGRSEVVSTTPELR
jgi:protein tyrosine/serine phosphatase